MLNPHPLACSSCSNPGVVIGKLGEGEEFVGGCVAQPRVRVRVICRRA